MLTSIAEGALSKMRVAHTEPLDYFLTLSGQEIHLNPLLGKTVRLEFAGNIHCLACSKKTKKSFNQGYCFRCFQTLAQCDRCIMSPELCHFHQGTCREPEWAQANCMTDHIVYLANSSGLKVGITRGTQVPTRWMDQGAIQAMPIARVKNRYHSGLVESACKALVSDRTNWRKMLKHEVEEMDLAAESQRIREQIAASVSKPELGFTEADITWLEDANEYRFTYPSLTWPSKVVSLNLDKTPVVEGVLMAIKGQYLILDSGCINIRKFTSYQVSLASE